MNDILQKYYRNIKNVLQKLKILEKRIQIAYNKIMNFKKLYISNGINMWIMLHNL